MLIAPAHLIGSSSDLEQVTMIGGEAYAPVSVTMGEIHSIPLSNGGSLTTGSIADQWSMSVRSASGLQQSVVLTPGENGSYELKYMSGSTLTGSLLVVPGANQTVSYTTFDGSGVKVREDIFAAGALSTSHFPPSGVTSHDAPRVYPASTPVAGAPPISSSSNYTALHPAPPLSSASVSPDPEMEQFDDEPTAQSDDGPAIAQSDDEPAISSPSSLATRAVLSDPISASAGACPNQTDSSDSSENLSAANNGHRVITFIGKLNASARLEGKGDDQLKDDQSPDVATPLIFMSKLTTSLGQASSHRPNR